MLDKGLMEKLERELNQERFLHTLRVRDTSIELAKIHNVDIEKAALAGLLHDCAKYKEKKDIIAKASFYKLELDEIFTLNPGLIHSYLGYYVAKCEYNIGDEEILNAIKYHTIGRKNMTNLEKIVYLADLIEPKRNYPKVEKIRSLSKIDLDQGLYLAINENIKHILDKNILIHPNTIEARNCLVKKLGNL